MKIVLVKVDLVKTVTCRNQSTSQCSPCLPTFSGPRSSSPQLLTKAVFRSTMKVKCWYWASTIYTNYSILSSQFSGECKEFYLKFMICLAENDNLTSACREDSKAYLGCRWVFRICLLYRSHGRCAGWRRSWWQRRTGASLDFLTWSKKNLRPSRVDLVIDQLVIFCTHKC